MTDGIEYDDIIGGKRREGFIKTPACTFDSEEKILKFVGKLVKKARKNRKMRVLCAVAGFRESKIGHIYTCIGIKEY